VCHYTYQMATDSFSYKSRAPVFHVAKGSAARLTAGRISHQDTNANSARNHRHTQPARQRRMRNLLRVRQT